MTPFDRFTRSIAMNCLQHPDHRPARGPASRWAACLATWLIAGLTGTALAQQGPGAATHGGHGGHGAPAAAAATPAADWAPAEVRRVDAANGRLTLRHGEIPSLQMPPMTMVFQVREAAMLGSVKVGDRVRFRAVSEGGKYIVTEIEPVR
jgi:Cu/Ag efflux protein CusF